MYLQQLQPKTIKTVWELLLAIYVPIPLSQFSLSTPVQLNPLTCFFCHFRHHYSNTKANYGSKTSTASKYTTSSFLNHLQDQSIWKTKAISDARNKKKQKEKVSFEIVKGKGNSIYT